MSTEFAGHVFSMSFAPRHGYVNTDRMASISEYVISKKTCLSFTCDVI